MLVSSLIHQFLHLVNVISTYMQLGPFTLTALLLPVLDKTPGARVVAVSSVAHMMPMMYIEDMMHDNPDLKYRSLFAYAYSKLSNLLFAFELAKRLKKSGSSVTAVACHPGYTFTPIQADLPWGDLLSRVIGMSQEQGALSLIYAAVDPSVKPGQYIGPDGLFFGFRGMPSLTTPTAQARDAGLQSKLWKLSEELTGMRFPFETSTKSKRVSSKRASSKRASKGKRSSTKSAERRTSVKAASKHGSVRA
jgi:NAD(P)-dependent dehydrogenase (short-subunit alcohol dehydrogenase family)